MDISYVKSIESKREKINKEAELFLQNSGLSNDINFFQFDKENEDYEDNLKKFKLLFDNGYDVVLWNSLIHNVSLEALNKNDFTNEEWDFLKKVSNEDRYKISGNENLNAEIETDRLVLCLPSEEKKEKFEEFFNSNPEEFFEYVGHEYEPGACFGLLEFKISHLFYLMEKENNELVGYIALKGQCDFVGVYNLEYFIFPKFRKKGYASEALNVLIKKAFNGDLIESRETIFENKLEVKKAIFDIIYIKTKHTNQGSIALADKLGFTYDGKIKKGYLFPDRELCFDELIYSLENSPLEESIGIKNCE